MSTKIDESGTASDVGASNHDEKVRHQPVRGLRHFVAIASPWQRGKPQATRAAVSSSASSSK